jgi:hypothetical protein
LNSEIEKEVGELPPIRIVISYRREDTPGGAGRLRQDLGAHFGREQVFLDIDAIPPGVDWIEEIEKTVSTADVLLPVIGLHWLTVTDENGHRRLDDPNDVLRFEIETALHAAVRVIPIQLHGAPMPKTDQLPASLIGLTRRQSIRIDDEDWPHDVQKLVRALERIRGEKAEALQAKAVEREAAERAERERLEQEAAAREAAERERLEREQAEREEAKRLRLDQEQAEAGRVAQEPSELPLGAERAPASEREVDKPAPALTWSSRLALIGAVLVLLSFALSIADGDSVLKYLTHYSEWGVFFVYSPIELVPAALAAAAVSVALIRGRFRAALAGGTLLGVGMLVAASAVALLLFFDLDAAIDLVPLVGAVLLVASAGLLVRSSTGAAMAMRGDTFALSLGTAGAFLIFVSVFVEYEEGSSMAGVGMEYALEPVVAAGLIAVALLLFAVLRRPFIAAGLLLAVGALTALHDVGVIVAGAIGGSPLRAAGFIGLVGGVLAVAAGAHTYRSSTKALWRS